MALAACTKKDVPFELPSSQTSYEFEAAGSTVFVTASSTDFEVESDADWVLTSIYRNNPKHNLRITVEPNPLASTRTARLSLVPANGDAPVGIDISQKPSDPYLTLDKKSVNVSNTFPSFAVTVTSNMEYEVEHEDWMIPDDDTAPAVGSVTFRYTVEKAKEDRNGKLTFLDKEGAVLATLSVYHSTYTLPLIDEDFSFTLLAVSTHIALGSTSGEKRFDQLDPDTTNGWTVETVNGNVNIWARDGYLRGSRTGAAGRLVSPALSSLSEPTEVSVSFRAARWYGAGGAHDASSGITIEIEGSGVPTVSSFTPDSDNGVNSGNWQEDPSTLFKFNITGADSDTKIVFITGPAETFSGACRMLIDDVKVEIVN